MKVLYLDESGHPNLAAIDPDFPIFVLGGVIVEQDYADGPLTDAFNAFKREMFGASDIVLHTADIVRNRNGFEALLDSTFRARFYHRLNQLIRDLDFKVVACAVLKSEYVQLHGDVAKDPYILGLEETARVFRFEIGDVRHGGVIVAERRSEHLDNFLIGAWASLTTLGAHNNTRPKRYPENREVGTTVQEGQPRRTSTCGSCCHSHSQALTWQGGQ